MPNHGGNAAIVARSGALGLPFCHLTDLVIRSRDAMLDDNVLYQSGRLVGHNGTKIIKDRQCIYDMRVGKPHQASEGQQ